MFTSLEELRVNRNISRVLLVYVLPVDLHIQLINAYIFLVFQTSDFKKVSFV